MYILTITYNMVGLASPDAESKDKYSYDLDLSNPYDLDLSNHEKNTFSNDTTDIEYILSPFKLFKIVKVDDIFKERLKQWLVEQKADSLEEMISKCQKPFQFEIKDGTAQLIE